MKVDDIEDNHLLSNLLQNDQNEDQLLRHIQFDDEHMISIVAYSILMIISASGNITVLILILLQRKKLKTRLNMMLLHLTIADLLVTFFLMPLEIAWATTITWQAGDVMCRIMSFFRVFGLYLSGFIIVCICLDRYFAIMKPLQASRAGRRGKIMVIIAWIVSAICSVPQPIIFHVEIHPNLPWYHQCVTFNSISSFESWSVMYNIFVTLMMYGIPIGVIIFTYSSIIIKIIRKLHDNQKNGLQSSVKNLKRAKTRTLVMTTIIVLVFFICWTPYYIMSTWYMIDLDSALKVDKRVQRCLFLFACTNSCMNPIVYGCFNLRNQKYDPGTSETKATNAKPIV